MSITVRKDSLINAPAVICATITNLKVDNFDAKAIPDFLSKVPKVNSLEIGIINGELLLATLPHLSCLKSLALKHPSPSKAPALGPEAFRALGALSNLTTLNISNYPVDAFQIQAFVESLHFSSLVNLNLSQDLNKNGLQDQGFIALLDSPRIVSLQRLVVCSNGLGPLAMQALARCRHLPNLTELELCGNPLTDDGIHSLATADLPNLVVLDIGATQLGDSGIAAFSEATGFPRLKVLKLLYNRKIGREGVKALAASRFSTQLEGLDLSCTKPAEDDKFVEYIDILAQPENFSNLKRLDLNHNGLRPEDIRTLLQSKQYGSLLNFLDVGDNALGNEGLEILAGHPFPNLDELSVYVNKIEVKGVSTLADSALFPKLKVLNIGGNNVADAVVKAKFDVSVNFPNLLVRTVSP